MHRLSSLRKMSVLESSVGQCMCTSPDSVLGEAAQNAVTPCCLQACEGWVRSVPRVLCVRGVGLQYCKSPCKREH